PVHTFVSNGQYTVTLIASIGGCQTQHTMTFFQQPTTASFTLSADTVCRYGSVFFDNTSSPPPSIIFWDFGDPGSGNYNYAYADTVVHPNYIQIIAPTVAITDAPDSGCIGESFTFHASTSTVAGDSVDQYTWNFHDGTGLINGSAVQTHVFNTCGVYDVSLN